MDIPSGCGCARPDIRTFTDTLCCLSCGLAIVGSTSSIATLQPKTSRQYTYKRLNNELGRDIRLIVLQPDVYDEKLRCTLVHTSLDCKPVFDAISYTWQEDRDHSTESRRSRPEYLRQRSKPEINTTTTKPPHHIYFQDGTWLEISHNCNEVLKRVRAYGARRPLWIDKICIDQEHVLERNHQVGMMDSIYREAQLVIVDVGDSTPSSEKLFGAIRNDNISPPSKLEVEEFLGRRWFQRIWVLQEVWLARHAVVRCGAHMVNWEHLKEYLHRHRPSGQLPAALDMDARPDKLLDLSQLLRTLRMTHNCQSSDPSDKIYALLGLCQPEVRRQVPVDYALPASQLFLRVAYLYIDHCLGDPSDLLKYAMEFPSASGPSWLPHWSEMPEDFWDENSSLPSNHSEGPLTGVLKTNARYLGKVRFVTSATSDTFTIYSPETIVVDYIREVDRRRPTEDQSLPPRVPETLDMTKPSEVWGDPEEWTRIRSTPVKDFCRTTGNAADGKTIFGTSDFLGLGPRSLQRGDEVWLVGEQRLFVALRMRGKDSSTDHDEAIDLKGEEARPRGARTPRRSIKWIVWITLALVCLGGWLAAFIISTILHLKALQISIGVGPFMLGSISATIYFTRRGRKVKGPPLVHIQSLQKTDDVKEKFARPSGYQIIGDCYYHCPDTSPSTTTLLSPVKCIDLV